MILDFLSVEWGGYYIPHFTGESQALLMFDNAPSYQKQAEDALLARKMPKGPKNVWPTQGPWMQDRKLPNSQPQLFCYPANHTKWPGWFKGMEQFIRECDFIGQKSALEKMIVARGHLCNFYPKYHSWAAGCTGMDTGYLKKKYRGHQMLPAGILREVRAAVDSL
ncbi:hypothetical protein BDV98DRAFT_581085 [Pterulicium gracile]|uniref:Uncharacterized protein n=1 Tax=Pterulicium gracile TaxID=1884261 RepID=A0A5C3R069_9AGAR|nr:hypothetical protein BDV98DRAFT_581085 [Pterula gracilis]